ncbi:putative F-box protein [Cardamine amara subsp. amara]|uniref:F-box protein n=1 Tax=Cardamine amara subsp. amara TaxID=228776 RepID=A0ABD0ZLC1_CARAN
MRTKHRSKRRKFKRESEVTSKTRRFVDEALVPTDLVFEILMRLPSKSIARFVYVSKLWATIIRSRNFIRTFACQTSLRQPSLLYALPSLKFKNEQGKQIWNFFSSSSTSTKEPSTYLAYTKCSIPHRARGSSNQYVNRFPHYVNGLISVIGPRQTQVICNPSIGKSITLPKVKSREKCISSFFGYDPVDDQYKVLCMSETFHDYKNGSSSHEHQVFTLGGVDKSWRMIECNILHRSKTNGLCINGVVYYGAWATVNSWRDEWCLARFDVRSEKFDQLVQFLGDHSPPPTSFLNPYLMSYKGKVTLAIEMRQRTFELWILEDAEKHEWSKICFEINHPLINSYCVRIMDVTNQLGEIMFSSPGRNPKDFYIIYYDQQKINSLRLEKIRGDSYKNFRRFHAMIPFFNYVESVMLL